MTFSLKRLTLDEMNRAAVVLRTSFNERLSWLADIHTPEEDTAFFRNHVFLTSEVWGAVDRDIIGIIAFRPGWIDQFYVMPDHQRQGVGGALLRVAMQQHANLSLWTFQRNMPARRFYEAKGFVAVDRTDGSANEEREPDILYRWDRPSKNCQSENSN